MTYKEYKDQRQKEFNELPIFFAFSKDQFKKAMEERGLTENDTDQLYGIGPGGYYLKKDAQTIRDFMYAEDPLPGLMKDPEFAEDAFYYEMANHEYHINWQGDWDVCQCFCDVEYNDEYSYADYLLLGDYDDSTIEAFKKARARFLKDCDENGWY